VVYVVRFMILKGPKLDFIVDQSDWKLELHVKFWYGSSLFNFNEIALEYGEKFIYRPT